METINKRILKTNYYYEFKSFYDSLPDDLPIPTDYIETVLTKITTEKEMIAGKKLLTKIGAFGLLAYVVKEKKLTKDNWKIGFFNDDDGIPCEFYARLRSDGRFCLDVRKVSESSKWNAGDGFFLSNKTLDTETQTLGNSDTLTLPNFINELKTLIKKYE